VASDIHKKFVLGALGCGVIFILGFGALVLVGRQASTTPAGDEEMFMLGQAHTSWDSIAHTAAAELLTLPALPAWTPREKASGYLHIAQTGKNPFPAFDDTFPAGSDEQKRVVLTAQRVVVLSGAARPRTDTLGTPPYIIFFRARIFLAAADDWSRHGDLPEAELAMDTVLTLARVSLHAIDLEQVLAGARIERDAMDLLWRDTLLAGGAATAERAALALAPWGRLTRRLESADHWMMSTGSLNTYDDSLASLVADSTLPMSWRAAAATALGMGWVFDPDETAKGIAKARSATLESLRDSDLPDSISSVLDRAAELSAGGFLDRTKAVADFRGMRRLLFQP